MERTYHGNPLFKKFKKVNSGEVNKPCTVTNQTNNNFAVMHKHFNSSDMDTSFNTAELHDTMSLLITPILTETTCTIAVLTCDTNQLTFLEHCLLKVL